MTTRHPELGNNRPADFSIGNHGSICLLVPHTDDARAWIDLYLPADAMRWHGSSVVVEPRFIEDIAAGIETDGLTIL